jgi:Plasmid pRiA4b ORF-3-like protein
MAPSGIILKITLRRIRPPIWRRVRVSGDMSLRDLHGVIQTAMGWRDQHLHEFEVGGRVYGAPALDGGGPDDRGVASEGNAGLGALVAAGVRRFRYVYDFGDDWEHEVTVEKVGPLDPARPYPSLIAGRRACPPEDCGGVPGYCQILEALAEPKAEEHEELLAWVGDDFDPERLDLDAIDRQLTGLGTRRRRGGRSRHGR